MLLLNTQQASMKAGISLVNRMEIEWRHWNTLFSERFEDLCFLVEIVVKSDQRISLCQREAYMHVISAEYELASPLVNTGINSPFQWTSLQQCICPRQQHSQCLDDACHCYVTLLIISLVHLTWQSSVVLPTSDSNPRWSIKEVIWKYFIPFLLTR